jgi:hypothetical protein
VRNQLADTFGKRRQRSFFFNLFNEAYTDVSFSVLFIDGFIISLDMTHGLLVAVNSIFFNFFFFILTNRFLTVHFFSFVVGLILLGLWTRGKFGEKLMLFLLLIIV